jgi:uncharacterized OB-fold protein
MSTSPFIEGLARGELRYQRCASCGAAQTLTRYSCGRCQGREFDWRVSRGRGTVYAVTVVARAPSDEFRALAPYTLALVDLDEGFRLLGHAVSGIAIGDRVVADYFIHGERTLVRFRPDHA